MITVIYTGMLVGMMIFALAALYLNYTEQLGAPFSAYKDTFLIVLFVLFAGVMTFSKRTVNKKLQDLVEKSKLSTRLEGYRTLLIIRFALLEALTLVGTVFYMLTNDRNILLVVGMLLIIFIIHRPTLKVMAIELQLSQEEANPETEI